MVGQGIPGGARTADDADRPGHDDDEEDDAKLRQALQALQDHQAESPAQAGQFVVLALLFLATCLVGSLKGRLCFSVHLLFEAVEGALVFVDRHSRMYRCRLSAHVCISQWVFLPCVCNALVSTPPQKSGH